MKLFMKMALVVSMVSVSFVSCASGTKVTRLDADAETDISGYWSMTDVDKVCADLIKQFLESPRVARFEAEKGRLPVIRVGEFKNSSSEPIDTSIVSKRMQVQILYSGKAEFVVDRGLSEKLHEAADYQEAWVKDGNAAEKGKEDGEDFILTGEVKTIIQTEDNRQTRTYDVTADASDITTHRIIWSGQNTDIRKKVARAKYKF